MTTAQQLLLLPSGSAPALAAGSSVMSCLANVVCRLNANVVTVACVASLACFLAYLLSRASSAKLFPAYQSFPLATKRDWDTRCAHHIPRCMLMVLSKEPDRFGSTLHAVAITAVAAYIASTHQTYFFNAASEPEVGSSPPMNSKLLLYLATLTTCTPPANTAGP